MQNLKFISPQPFTCRMEEVFDAEGVPYPSRKEWENRFAELEARMVAELDSRAAKVVQEHKPSADPLTEITLKSLENRRELQKLESQSVNHRLDKTGDRLSQLEDDFQKRHTLSENFENGVMERIQASVAKVAEDMGLSHESLDSRIERKLQVFMRDLEAKTDRIENTLRLRSNELEAGIKKEEASRMAAVGTVTTKLIVHDDILSDHQRQLNDQMRHIEERCQQEHAYTDATKVELQSNIDSLRKQVEKCQEDSTTLREKVDDCLAQVDEQMQRMQQQMKEMKKMGDGLKLLEERVEYALTNAAKQTQKGFEDMRAEMKAMDGATRGALNKLADKTREDIETLRMGGEEAEARQRADLRNVREDLFRKLADAQKDLVAMLKKALQTLEDTKNGTMDELGAMQQRLKEELLARIGDLQAELDRRSRMLRADLTTLNERVERDLGAVAERLEEHGVQLDNRLTLQDAEKRFGEVNRALGIHGRTLDAAEQMLNDHEKVLRKINKTLGTFPTLDSPNRASRRLSSRIGSPDQAAAVAHKAEKGRRRKGSWGARHVSLGEGSEGNPHGSAGAREHDDVAVGASQVKIGALLIERGENLSNEALDAAILAEREGGSEGNDGVEVPMAEEPQVGGRQLVSKLLLGQGAFSDSDDDSSDCGMGLGRKPTSVAESLAMLTEQAELHELELQRLDAQINAVLNELVDKYGVKAMRLMLKLHAKDVKEAYYVFETKVVRGEVAYGKSGCFVPGGMSVELVAEKAQLSAQLIAKLVDFSFIAHCLGPMEQRGGYYMVRTPEQRRQEEVDEFVNVLVLGALPLLPKEGTSSKILAAGSARKGFEEQLRRALALALSKYTPVKDDGTLFSKKQLLPACVACNRPLHSGAAAALFMDKENERRGPDSNSPPANKDRWDDGFDESVASSSDAGDYGGWDHRGGGGGDDGLFPYDDREGPDDDLEVYKRFKYQKKREGKQQLLHAMGRNERRFMYGAMGTGELQQAAEAAAGPAFVTVGGFKMPKKIQAPRGGGASRSDPAFVSSAAVAAMDQTQRMRPTSQVQLGGQPQLAKGRPQSAHSSRQGARSSVEPMRGRVRPQSAARVHGSAAGAAAPV
jgi:hypothetical protein